jgi:heme o synthase
MSLVIAAACVFNNYLDRDIDKKMQRTRRRALVIGTISPQSALIYASILYLLGSLILLIFTNWLVFGLGVLSIFLYVAIYGLAKRRTVYSTLLGSIPGAAPPAAGYLAVTNHIDGATVILFLCLVFWQMPHFYAIAMYRYKDYKAAGLPVLTVRKGMAAAKIQIMLYIAAFTVTAALLSALGYAGYVYLVAVLVMGTYWFWRGLQGYKSSPSEKWGRKMFLVSLIVTFSFSLVLSINSWVP